MEKWKKIDGCEAYEVSTHGKVRSVDRLVRGKMKNRHMRKGQVLSQVHSNGYLIVPLSLDGKRVTRHVHRLVAEAFIERMEPTQEVNHKDGNKKNNYVENLEWVSSKKNRWHAAKVLKSRDCRNRIYTGYGNDGGVRVRFQSSKEAIKNGYNPKLVQKSIKENGFYSGYRWKIEVADDNTIQNA